MNSTVSGLRRTSLVALTSTALLASSSAYAGHFKVYGTGQPKQNEMEVVYWMDYVAQSDNSSTLVGKPVAREGMVGHTLELEYGITDKWAIGFYSDFEKAKGEDLQYAQTRAVASRVKLFDNGERFFDASIYFEYYAPREKYIGGPGDKLEARIILEKQSENWDFRLNPKFEKAVAGANVGEPLEFEYATGLFRKINSGLNLGLEAYGKLGEIANIQAIDKQEHYLVPSVEYNIAPELWINAGVAFGITDPADDVTFKTYVEFEF